MVQQYYKKSCQNFKDVCLGLKVSKDMCKYVIAKKSNYNLLCFLIHYITSQ